MDLHFLGLLWILWCMLHSLMITRTVTGFLAGMLGDMFKYYRIFYNITAVITLLPLLVLTRNMHSEAVFVWQGYWLIARILLLAAAALLFWAGARRYDMGYFLGIRQVLSGTAHTLLSDSEEFSTIGVFGLTRHPWYLASFLLIWSILPAYAPTDLVVAAVLSLYLLVGTVLEEGKLLAEYGDRYRSYQRQVSMLLPWKWLQAKVKGIFRP
jgi:protein-S-isoprenylcysteine O-methyltransferase Ste14